MQNIFLPKTVYCWGSLLGMKKLATVSGPAGELAGVVLLLSSSCPPVVLFFSFLWSAAWPWLPAGLQTLLSCCPLSLSFPPLVFFLSLESSLAAPVNPMSACCPLLVLPPPGCHCYYPVSSLVLLLCSICPLPCPLLVLFLSSCCALLVLILCSLCPVLDFFLSSCCRLVDTSLATAASQSPLLSSSCGVLPQERISSPQCQAAPTCPARMSSSSPLVTIFSVLSSSYSSCFWRCPVTACPSFVLLVCLC